MYVVNKVNRLKYLYSFGERTSIRVLEEVKICSLKKTASVYTYKLSLEKPHKCFTALKLGK